jgi:hypothetical protein
MIIRELYLVRKDGIKLYRTYSDLNHYILQQPTNIKYGEAIDVENAPYTYVETDEVIINE